MIIKMSSGFMLSLLLKVMWRKNERWVTET